MQTYSATCDSRELSLSVWDEYREGVSQHDQQQNARVKFRMTERKTSQLCSPLYFLNFTILLDNNSKIYTPLKASLLNFLSTFSLFLLFQTTASSPSRPFLFIFQETTTTYWGLNEHTCNDNFLTLFVQKFILILICNAINVTLWQSFMAKSLQIHRVKFSPQ